MIRSLIPEQILNSTSWEEDPPFRPLTFRVLATLLFQLTFNRKCVPSPLRIEEAQHLVQAFQISVQNLIAAFDTNIAKVKSQSQPTVVSMSLGSQEQAWHEKVVHTINEEFTAMKGQMSDSAEIDAILENPLIMVSAIPQEEPQVEESKQAARK